jgi:2-methylcitrate dehydratase PrpD
MAINTTVAADHNAPPITKILAEFVANHPSKGWSDAVEHEAVRTFVNWLGCAVGAANHEAVIATLKATQTLLPPAQALIAGRRDRVDMASAALINGISSHTFDFDDTHLKTIIHPAGPVASALLALAEVSHATGRQLIDALVLGIDVSCRVGNMMYPQHYDRGWHITGSTGTLGAAAACSRMMGLNAQQTAMALGIAASQPVGLREQFGTMTKPLHPGAAARAGLMSALMAREGFTSSTRAIEAPRGFAQVLSTKYDWNEITHELGERFEISFNTYKPFACGIVIHPSIDACISLRNEFGLKASDIASIELRAHSLVLELTGKKTPQTGLEGKFSVYHASAAGIIYGRAGEEEFSDAVVRSPELIALRDRITAVVDDSIDEAAVSLSMRLNDGRVVTKHIEHAIGSMERPMSDAALTAKFADLSDPLLGAATTKRLTDAAWNVVNGGIPAIIQNAVPAAS